MKKNLKPTKARSDRLFYTQVRELIVAARKTVSRGVDLVQVNTCFEIGRHIVEYEQAGSARAGYGKEIIKDLAKNLTKEFGTGFSLSNLKLMRQFYLVYQDPFIGKSQTVSGQSRRAKSQTVSGQLKESRSKAGQPFSLSWSHYAFLMGVKNPEERRFYEIEAASQDWTFRELKRQFDSSLYERLALSRDKKGVQALSKKGQVLEDSKDILKEPLVLEFLGLSDQARYSETELESAIINRMEHFLLELGKGFLFEARQKRFTFDSDHFFVDLVLYNRLLRCYVVIDLKIGKLTHQDLGQMQMYVNYFDRHVKTKEENPTIGIILCKKKNESLVEITLPKGANIHAREYKLYLPSKVELRKKLQEWAAEVEG